MYPQCVYYFLISSTRFYYHKTNVHTNGVKYLYVVLSFIFIRQDPLNLCSQLGLNIKTQFSHCLLGKHMCVCSKPAIPGSGF